MTIELTNLEPTIEQSLIAMKIHTLANPTHGIGCACKDEHMSAIRRRIVELDCWREFELTSSRAISWWKLFL